MSSPLPGAHLGFHPAPSTRGSVLRPPRLPCRQAASLLSSGSCGLPPSQPCFSGPTCFPHFPYLNGCQPLFRSFATYHPGSQTWLPPPTRHLFPPPARLLPPSRILSPGHAHVSGVAPDSPWASPAPHPQDPPSCPASPSSVGAGMLSYGGFPPPRPLRLHRAPEQVGAESGGGKARACVYVCVLIRTYPEHKFYHFSLF